ncbi:MAG: M3 family oligoendopeptidase [Nitrospinota bacterium]|nr:M3 family oligoendopeptidase [Nitrospinota bacterium]
MNKKIESAEWLKPFPRKFVQNGFKVSDAGSIKPWVERLTGRDLNSADELVRWLEDYSELLAVISEDSNRRYVEMTCDTKDESKKEAYLFFVREIQPKLTEWGYQLDKKYYDCPHRSELPKEEFKRLDMIFSTHIELFSEKNIPIEVKLSEMSQQYQSITGGWMVEFDGKKQTMPQMSRHMLKTDRSIREKAWRATSEKRLEDKEKLDTLFDEMLKARQEYATNLGLADFREYSFRSKLRDYSPEDCLKFHDSIEKTAVPLVRKLAERRKEKMKLENLRPWDMAVDPLGRSPLSPFEKVEELQDGVESIFQEIDPRLGERFNSIRKYMDLDSREGKAPGGYQTTYEEQRAPFIFTNAAGVHADITTLLHEGGHAFHTLQCRNNPLVWYRHASMEFSEVASMTQELFGNRYLDIFYKNPEEANRARLEQLERVADIFPWVATVDAFQHWIYTNPGHSARERGEKWLEITARFEVKLDWNGLNHDVKRYSWHRQLHIFEVPFYYIEYAIAQLGALQLYRLYKEEPSKAVDSYLGALALGGKSGPSALFDAAGIKFDFSAGNLSSLMKMVSDEIDELSK